MLALRLHAANDARLEELPEPELRPGTVKVRIARAGICGSDLSLYEYFPLPADYVNPVVGEHGPHVLGHEFSGYVEEVADDVSAIAVGDLVAVQPNLADGTCPSCLAGNPNICDNYAFIGIHGGGGGFSEVVVAPADHIFGVPAEVGPEAAALVEPISVGWHAARMAGEVGPEVTALIIGAGPIGLAVQLSLLAMGAGRVVVSEPSPSRRQLAADLGASTVIDPTTQDVVQTVRELTGGRGADMTFDASGVGKVTLQPALDALKASGTAVLVAGVHGGIEMDFISLLSQEKYLTGSFAYTSTDFREARDAIVDGRIPTDRLVTSRIALSDVVDGGLRHLLGEGRASEVKVMILPGSDAPAPVTPS